MKTKSNIKSVIKSVKYVICLVLILTTCIIIAGCTEKMDNRDSIYNGDSQNQEYEQNNNNSYNNVTNNEDSNYNEEENTALKKFDAFTIRVASPFSEGYAFVEDDWLNPTKAACINTNGDIVFMLEEKDKCLEGFHNGCAIIKHSGNEVMINTKGEIIASSVTHGYTKFLKDSYNYVYDNRGYHVKKEIITVNGTSYQYGVIAPDGTWAVNLSENETYIAPSTPADEWKCSYTKFVDFNNQVKLDISLKIENVFRGLDFKSGFDVTGTVIKTKSNYNTYLFFTLIDRNGNMLFEPYRILNDNYIGIYSCGEIGYIYAIDATEDTYFLNIYDKQGNVVVKHAIPNRELADNFLIDKIFVETTNGKIFAITAHHSNTHYNVCYYINDKGEMLFETDLAVWRKQ